MSHRSLRLLATGATVAAALAFAPLGATVPTAPASTSAEQGPVPAGAQYREEYIETLEVGTVGGIRPDTTIQLHADVLRSEEAAWSEKQPVVLVVSPYTNHNDGGTAPTSSDGPNPRFYDFLDVTNALDRGYTFVQVDLPGFGGSSGCNDWGGPAEQRAVKDAVEWAAAQPWSTGRVALLGKSYDGWTGLMGMAQDPVGLAAVVSMEPVYSGYRYLYNDGVRFLNSVVTPTIFQVYDAAPGSINDDVAYHVNGTPHAYCWGLNMAEQQQDTEDAAFWADRDLVELPAGSDVPLFLTQGFLESNTKPDAAFAFWNALDGEHNRAWFGQFNHVRGWETEGNGRFAMGRSVFAEELNRFLDEHLKGIEPDVDDPAIAVQDNLGRYRAEEAWPPADAVQLSTDLATGSFADGSGSATSTQGVWSVSQDLPHTMWLAGEPVVSATVVTDAPRTNLVANVYDVAPDGTATLVTRGTTLVRGVGEQTVDVALYGQDWMLRTGHRIAVRLVGGNSDWWVHVPTGTTVDVVEADVTLPFLTQDRTEFLDGSATSRLEAWLGANVVGIDGTGATDVVFTLPGPLS